MKVFKKMVLVLVAIAMSYSSYSQWKDDVVYKRWRIHTTQMVYRSAGTQHISGKYTINTKPMRSYKVGMEYYFNLGKSYHFFSGLNLTFLPLNNFEYQFPGSEIGSEESIYFNKDDRHTRSFHSILSMPLGILYEQELKGNWKWFAKGGVNVDFLGFGEVSRLYTIVRNGMEKEYLLLYYTSQAKNVFYPGLFLGGGIDYYTSFAKIHLSVTMQKSLIPYMQGYYEFSNMNHSSNSYGNYILRADYIGLDLGITLKKFKH